jgi:hypothetical protein
LILVAAADATAQFAQNGAAESLEGVLQDIRV